MQDNRTRGSPSSCISMAESSLDSSFTQGRSGMGQVFALCWLVLSHGLIRHAKACGTALNQPRRTPGQCEGAHGTQEESAPCRCLRSSMWRQITTVGVEVPHMVSLRSVKMILSSSSPRVGTCWHKLPDPRRRITASTSITPLTV